MFLISEVPLHPSPEAVDLSAETPQPTPPCVLQSLVSLMSRAPTLHPTPYTLHPTPHTLHPTPYTLHPTPYTLHLAPYTLHPTPYTLHPALCTLHSAPHTIHPAPYTLQPTPYTVHPAPCTLITDHLTPYRTYREQGGELIKQTMFFTLRNHILQTKAESETYYLRTVDLRFLELKKILDTVQSPFHNNTESHKKLSVSISPNSIKSWYAQFEIWSS